MFTQNNSHSMDRASVIPIAFLLLLAILLIGVNIYHIKYVPAKSVSAEVESNRALLSDVREFDFAVRESVISGNAQPVSIGSPIDYPVSVPPRDEPEYIISTTETETIDIENYVCQEGDCQSSLNTTTVIFLADYNYLKNDRIYGYEYGIIYSAENETAEGSQGVITYNNQFIIQNNRITMMTFNGNYTAERPRTVHTTLKPQQKKTGQYIISGDNGPVNITLPTELSEDRWSGMLEDELVENGGHIQNIDYQNYTMESTYESNHPSGKRKSHWEDCDHSGNGRPFVSCTIDNSTSYVSFTLEEGQNYTVDSTSVTLTD